MTGHWQLVMTVLTHKPPGAAGRPCLWHLSKARRNVQHPRPPGGQWWCRTNPICCLFCRRRVHRNVNLAENCHECARHRFSSTSAVNGASTGSYGPHGIRLPSYHRGIHCWKWWDTMVSGGVCCPIFRDTNPELCSIHRPEWPNHARTFGD